MIYGESRKENKKPLTKQTSIYKLKWLPKPTPPSFYSACYKNIKSWSRSKKITRQFFKHPIVSFYTLSPLFNETAGNWKEALKRDFNQIILKIYNMRTMMMIKQEKMNCCKEFRLLFIKIRIHHLGVLSSFLLRIVSVSDKDWNKKYIGWAFLKDIFLQDLHINPVNTMNTVMQT